MKQKQLNRISCLLLAGVAGYWFIQRLGKRGGASDQEVHAALPGDNFIPHPMVETTHGITIHASPATIWKWLIQAGYRGSGRAGWYGDTWITQLGEGSFLRLTVPDQVLRQDRGLRSTNEILPEYQHSKVGDIIPDGPPGTVYFIVKQVDAERTWVLYSTTHIQYLTPKFLQNSPLKTEGEFTWVFVLNPINEHSTRLVLRTRANFGPPLLRKLLTPLIYAAEAIIPRSILGGIKQRAENIR